MPEKTITVELTLSDIDIIDEALEEYYEDDIGDAESLIVYNGDNINANIGKILSRKINSKREYLL
jgi:hypothetical protein